MGETFFLNRIEQATLSLFFVVLQVLLSNEQLCLCWNKQRSLHALNAITKTSFQNPNLRSKTTEVRSSSSIIWYSIYEPTNTYNSYVQIFVPKYVPTSMPKCVPAINVFHKFGDRLFHARRFHSLTT